MKFKLLEFFLRNLMSRFLKAIMVLVVWKMLVIEVMLKQFSLLFTFLDLLVPGCILFVLCNL